METVKTMEIQERILAEHPFLKDLEPRHLQFMAACASELYFAAGQYIFQEGEAANQLYLIGHGKVALGTVTSSWGFSTIEILDDGDVLGWSWLIPPHRWYFTALAILPTWVIALDGKQLREKCQADHEFGYELVKRIDLIAGQRLRITRMRLG
jgi:CRP-like cAMP-binding protein